jgi:hypothetical protein
MDGLANFREISLCDFEFSAPPGERPTPLCMVVREFRTGRTCRYWHDELRGLSRPPFDTGPDCLFVAYYASAELGCFKALDWPAPKRILDLYPEFRNITCGLTVPCGYGLLGALSWYGLDGLSAVEKDSMRELALRGEPYTTDERRALLDYCQTDVDALARLLPAMLPSIDLLRALLRGRYMAAVARMEWAGVPIDTEALNALRASWTAIQDRLIERIDAGRGIYLGRTFKAGRFAAWLIEQGIPWPRLESGSLDLSDDCFREMGRAYPEQVSPIRELRTALSQLRLESLPVGSDGRNRYLMSPFSSRTSRNQPSNAENIFGPATWLRGLIRPKFGSALGYLDWSQQEFGIAAALSGDTAMMEAYRSSDPYLTFAMQAGEAPPDATAETHRAARERFKVLSLGVQYGMSGESLARRLDEAPIRGRELIRLHRQTYPRYWQWSDDVEMTAFLSGTLQATFGWTIHVGPNANPRSLRNFPLQANGAEMLRLACIRATERGIKVCAPIHDALLIEAPADAIDDAVAATQAAMEEASKIVLAGFPLRANARIILAPDRYMDPRGVRFWNTVWELIAPIPTPDGAITPTTGGTPAQSNSFLYRRERYPHDPPYPPEGGTPLTPRTHPTPDPPWHGGTGEAQMEAPLPTGADPDGLAGGGDGTSGPCSGCRADPLAGSRPAQEPHSAVAASTTPRRRNPTRRRKARGAVAGTGRASVDPPTAGPLFGSDDLPAAGPLFGSTDPPRHGGTRRETALDPDPTDDPDQADMEAEREAIRGEGCTEHTQEELAELALSETFPA